MRLRGGTETVSRRIPLISCKWNIYNRWKKQSSRRERKKTQTALAKRGLEAGLKIKLNRVSMVGREGRDQATR